MGITDPSPEFRWGAARPQHTVQTCPVCHAPICSLHREDTGEIWYFHGAAVSCPSLVMDGVTYRRALQAEKVSQTLTGRIAHWCREQHRWEDHRPLKALLFRLRAEGRVPR
jgi:hypothetical protein